MPPKKKANEPSKKTELKKKEKVIEDKTFGIKNKKGTKQQKFIKTVTHQIQHGGQKVKEMEKPGDKKRDKKDELDELNKLFRPVQQTVGKGVDPKSVICAFFKQGQCTKGDRCKFSHDLNVSRKGEKKNLYEDVRNDDDNMDDWDEAKLEEVVNQKHGESDKAKPKTSIICKYFLEAVENSKYGWFWECPNAGNKCMYRHALPAGFVLKKDQKKVEKEEQVSIEELIEKERASLGFNTTRVTLETFLKWKERKRKEKIQSQKATQDKKKSDFKMGKMFGISGRELFEFNPDLVTGDDEEATDEPILREMEDDDDEGDSTSKYTDLTSIGIVPTDVDGTGTVAQRDRLAATQASGEPPTANGLDGTAEALKLDEAAALGPSAGASGDTTETDAAIAAAMAATMNGDINIDNMAIDEDLFDEEGLDLLEEDLETLELND